MDFLWSPWRYAYVTGQTAPADSGRCVFCEIGSTSEDDTAGIVFRGRHTFVVLNQFPYTSGHLMIVPYAHVATLEQCSDAILAETMRLARRAEINLRELYRCPGLNLGWNIGECAGAGVAAHIHLHVLPRWPGDASFLTSIGETRVLPEDLATSLAKMKSVFWN